MVMVQDDESGIVIDHLAYSAQLLGEEELLLHDEGRSAQPAEVLEEHGTEDIACPVTLLYRTRTLE
jgi:hypothetical protein